MASDPNKIHLVKKKGQWMKHNDEIEPFPPEGSAVPEPKPDQRASVNEDSDERSLQDALTELERSVTKAKRRLKREKSVNSLHRRVKQSKTIDTCNGGDSLVDSHEDLESRHEPVRTWRLHTRPLSTSEICAELESVTKHPRTMSPITSSGEELEPVNATPIVLEKSKRLNTKENSPVKENRAKQTDGQEPFKSMKKSTSYFGTEVSRAENIIVVSPCQYSCNLSGKRRKKRASLKSVEISNSTLSKKLDLNDQTKSPLAVILARPIGIKDQEEDNKSLSLFDQLIRNGDVVNGSADDNSLCNSSSPKQVPKVTVSEDKSTPQDLQKNLQALALNTPDSAGKWKTQLQNNKEEVIQRTVSVDNIMTYGEITIPLENNHRNSYVQAQSSVVPRHNVASESVVSYSYPTCYKDDGDLPSYMDCVTSFNHKRQYNSRDADSKAECSLGVEMMDTSGMINIDQLYQDLAGIPMVHLERVSEKTLAKYYGIKLVSKLAEVISDVSAGQMTD